MPTAITAALITATATIAATLLAASFAAKSGHLRISIDGNLAAPETVTVVTTQTVTAVPTGGSDGDGNGGVNEVGTAAVPLSELEPLNRRPRTGPIVINSVDYSDGVYDQVGGCGREKVYEYEIGRKYAMFSAVAGLASGTDPDTVVRFEVFVDDVSRAQSPPLRVGADHEFDVPIDNGFILRIEATETEGDLGGCSNDGTAAWGDAAVTP